jgi:hypothetical protein
MHISQLGQPNSDVKTFMILTKAKNTNAVLKIIDFF